MTLNLNVQERHSSSPFDSQSDDAANEYTLVFLYYDNPQMLRAQLRCWSSYKKAFKRTPTIVLVDDGSPQTRAHEIVAQVGCGIPIKVFRIHEDIRWNFAGARNLGCMNANGWIYSSDIDTILTRDDARLLFEADALESDSFYMPVRVWLPNLNVGRPGFVNLLFHKSKFLEIGGYDEDYSGHYGREEIDFFERLKKRARCLSRQDIRIRVMPPFLIDDACTKDVSRDPIRNREIYRIKSDAGFPFPIDPIRFSWERVL